MWKQCCRETTQRSRRTARLSSVDSEAFVSFVPSALAQGPAGRRLATPTEEQSGPWPESAPFRTAVLTFSLLLDDAWLRGHLQPRSREPGGSAAAHRPTWRPEEVASPLSPSRAPSPHGSRPSLAGLNVSKWKKKKADSFCLFGFSVCVPHSGGAIFQFMRRIHNIYKGG